MKKKTPHVPLGCTNICTRLYTLVNALACQNSPGQFALSYKCQGCHYGYKTLRGINILYIYHNYRI